MLQAISQLSSSTGSYLGSYLADVLNIEVGEKGIKKATNFKKLINKYQSDLINRAQKDPDWNAFSTYLLVILDKSETIRVTVTGSAEVREAAMLLEVGAGATPAKPFLRIAEAEFNSDFDWRKMFKK